MVVAAVKSNFANEIQTSNGYASITVETHPLCVNFQLNRKTGEVYIHSFGVDQDGNMGPVEQAGVVSCGDTLVMISGEEMKGKEFSECIALLRSNSWPKKLVFNTNTCKQSLASLPSYVTPQKDILVALKRTNSFLIDHLGEDKAVIAISSLQGILKTAQSIQAGSLRSLIHYTELLLSNYTTSHHYATLGDIYMAIGALYRLCKNKEKNALTAYQASEMATFTKLKALERQKQTLEKKAKDEYIQLCENVYSHRLNEEWKRFEELIQLLKKTESEYTAQKLESLCPQSLGYRLRFGSGGNYFGAENIWLEKFKCCVKMNLQKNKPQFTLLLQGTGNDLNGATLMVKIVHCKCASEGVGEFVYEDLVINAQFNAAIPLEYNGREWNVQGSPQVTFNKLESFSDGQVNRKVNFAMKYIIRAIVTKVTEKLLASEVILSSLMSSQDNASTTIKVECNGYPYDVINTVLPHSLKNPSSDALQACQLLEISLSQSCILVEVQKEISKTYPLEDLSIYQLVRIYLQFFNHPDDWMLLRAHWQRAIDLYCSKTSQGTFSIDPMLKKVEMLSKHEIEMNLQVINFNFEVDIDECLGNGFRQSALRTASQYEVDKIIKNAVSLPTSSMQENLSIQQKTYREICQRVLEIRQQFVNFSLDFGGQFNNDLSIYAKRIFFSGKPTITSNLKNAMNGSNIAVKTQIEEYPNQYTISFMEKNEVDVPVALKLGLTDVKMEAALDIPKILLKAQENEKNLTALQVTFQPFAEGDQYQIKVETMDYMILNVQATRAVASIALFPTLLLLCKNDYIPSPLLDFIQELMKNLDSIKSNFKLEFHFAISMNQKNLVIRDQKKPCIHLHTRFNLIDLF